jgi:dihydrofolate reductase
MGRIVVSENATLDGVVEDPAGDEGLPYGGWFNDISGTDRQAWNQVGLEEALGAKALLLGRHSDAWFAARWLTRSGEWADRLNSMPKYVMSSTLAAAQWINATVLKGELAREVEQLRREIVGDIVVIGSSRLTHALWEKDLVDELRLKVFPVVAGSGRRLFGESQCNRAMRLVSVSTLGDSIAYLTYERAREAQ